MNLVAFGLDSVPQSLNLGFFFDLDFFEPFFQLLEVLLILLGHLHQEKVAFFKVGENLDQLLRFFEVHRVVVFKFLNFWDFLLFQQCLKLLLVNLLDLIMVVLLVHLFS